MLSDIKIYEILKKWDTPLYLFDIHELKNRLGQVKKIFGENIKLCYAMKANPFLITYLKDLVDKFEVCSPGEYSICKKENIPSEKIILSGVYKSEADIQESFQDNFRGIYTVESMRQYELLKKYALKYKIRIEIIIRLTSGNQFGLDRNDLYRLISENKNISFIKIKGLHYFSGTQKKNSDGFRNEIEEIISLCDELKDRYGFHAEHIEYGAGLFYNYYDEKSDNYSLAECLAKILNQYEGKYQITVELGRYLVASCGQYVTKVVDVKRNSGRNYCIVDGGIHHINYYGHMLGIKIPSVHILRAKKADGINEKWNVCGALCTIHDMLLKNYESENICVDDIFIFDDVGAYSVTEAAALFLSRELPLIIVADDDFSVIRTRKPTCGINSREI